MAADPGVPTYGASPGSSVAEAAMLLPAACHLDEQAPVHGFAPLPYIVPSWITWPGWSWW